MEAKAGSVINGKYARLNCSVESWDRRFVISTHTTKLPKSQWHSTAYQYFFANVLTCLISSVLTADGKMESSVKIKSSSDDWGGGLWAQMSFCTHDLILIILTSVSVTAGFSSAVVQGHTCHFPEPTTTPFISYMQYKSSVYPWPRRCLKEGLQFTRTKQSVREQQNCFVKLYSLFKCLPHPWPPISISLYCVLFLLMSHLFLSFVSLYIYVCLYFTVCSALCVKHYTNSWEQDWLLKRRP